VPSGFARFAALFDRVAIVCYQDSCKQQVEAWPEDVRPKVRLVDGYPINAKLGILGSHDHGCRVTQGHAGAWELLGADVASLLILEDDYRPINATAAALADSSALADISAFVGGDSWQMLRVGYIPHTLPASACSAVCACTPSSEPTNMCQVRRWPSRARGAPPESRGQCM
jgi:hypothetical protein